MRLKKSSQTIFIYLVVAFVVLYGTIIAIRALGESAFFDKRDRINIVFYNEHSLLLSFGLSDNVNYIVSFNNKDRVTVPGGYGRYAVGALGRLTEVQKDREIIQKSFSSMVSAYVDYYVVPKKSSIFDADIPDISQYPKTHLTKSLFSDNVYTNIGILDKIYIAFLIVNKREQDFIPLQSISQPSEDGGGELFSERGFFKKYKGFFYHQGLREEGKEIQILYGTYKSAVTLTRIIEGQGVRIVDLSTYNAILPDYCTIHTNIKGRSQTLHYLEKRWQCRIEKEQVEGSDIILIPGARLEKKWE